MSAIRAGRSGRSARRPGRRPFQGQFNTNYTVAFASYLLALMPLVVVYLLCQRWVIAGVMRGSIK